MKSTNHSSLTVQFKLLTTESGSSLAAALWDGCDAALSSRLAYPEVRAALAAAVRNHDLAESELAESELADAEHDWEDFWAAGCRVAPAQLDH